MAEKNYNPGYVLGITLAATVGGLLLGYDVAIVSATSEAIKTNLMCPLHLSNFVQGISLSIALAGCIIGAILSGFFSSRLGRRKSLMLAASLLFISALGAAFPEFFFSEKGETSVEVLIMFNIYRILGGIGIGIISAVVPVYIAEIAPTEIRGRLISFNQFAIILGLLIAYFISGLITYTQPAGWLNETGWRYMFVSEIIPAILFGTLVFFIPETPRYLTLSRQDARALGILEKINTSKEHSQRILFEIKSTVSGTEKGKLFAYGKRVIIVGILLLLFQLLAGINVLIYYVPHIFESVSTNINAALLQSILMFICIVSTMIAVLTVDKWGRKPLLITGSIGMAVSMFTIAALAYFNVAGIITLIFIFIYLISFMMSWGPVCWVLISEIFPNMIRSRAVALVTAFQWTVIYFISFSHPTFIKFEGVITYGFYGLMALLSALFIWKMLPETKGKSLEEINELWNGNTWKEKKQRNNITQYIYYRMLMMKDKYEAR